MYIILVPVMWRKKANYSLGVTIKKLGKNPVNLAVCFTGMKVH